MKNEEIINSIINSFHEKKNSHAFLLETNNLESCYKDLINMIKVLNCKNGTIDDCNVCHTIDVGTNPDIITIKPVKKEIGVEPINNIIKVFSTQPLISKYSMYIIYEADLLSVSAANTILKFLEEPEEGIVGFFITSRLSSMLPTITSRCELINMRYGNNSVLDLLNISEEEYMAYYNIAKHMIGVLNYKTNYERLYKANDITKYEREEIIKIFKIIHNIYVIKFENIINNEYNNLEYAQEILNIIDEKDPSLIAKRIKKIEHFLNDFKYNVNKELFINKLFITWE
jgi:DNA polymerase III gamma/tau subunit